MKKNEPWFLPDIYQHAPFEGVQVENGQLVHVREQGKKGSGRVLRVRSANSSERGLHVLLLNPADRRPVRDLKADEGSEGALRLTGWSIDGRLEKKLRIRPANPREQRRVTRALQVLEFK